jgi:hypothetical protein
MVLCVRLQNRLSTELVTEVSFCNSAEVGFFSELVFTSAEFRTKYYTEFRKKCQNQYYTAKDIDIDMGMGLSTGMGMENGH